ncbi:MAG: DUF600 family protein [Oscillospiraceae bacterium]|nr:DUF600 family protein [Oscillospiraceae bacterium]
MTVTIEKIQNKIATILFNLCPVPWDSIYLFGEGTDFNACQYFCVKESQTKVIISSNYFFNRYDKETESKKVDYYDEVNGLLIELHQAYTKTFGKEKSWTTATFIVQSNGKFDIDFTYDKKLYKTRTEWEIKYFGEPVKFIQVKYPGTTAIK